jgi:hypothetical protein
VPEVSVSAPPERLPQDPVLEAEPYGPAIAGPATPAHHQTLVDRARQPFALVAYPDRFAGATVVGDRRDLNPNGGPLNHICTISPVIGGYQAYPGATTDSTGSLKNRLEVSDLLVPRDRVELSTHGFSARSIGIVRCAS